MTNFFLQFWKSSLLLFFICWGHFLYGQIEVEPATTDPFTPENLIRNIFAGKGIDIINVNYRGLPEATGFYSNGQADINLSEGLVMTTGKVFEIVEPNNAGGQGSENQNPDTDPDLESIATESILDAAIFEIEFVPSSDTIEFKYVFASEEYPEFGCNCFNDVFGFFLRGPGYPTFENIGLVPGSTDPVSVRTIHPTDPDGNVGSCSNGSPVPDCNPVNEHLYNDNTGSPNWIFDGYTNVLTAKAKVEACQTYTIKLTIADVKDGLYDSAVFFEGRSFGSDVLEVSTSTLSIDGTIVEGCSRGIINFDIPKALDEDITINYGITGTATNGVDYETIPNFVIIPAGSVTANIPINAIEDDLNEGRESVGIIVDLNACKKDTFWLYIRDSELPSPDLGPDQSICPGDEITLSGDLNILFDGEKKIESATKNINIPTVPNNIPEQNGNNSIQAAIDVSGVLPPDINPHILKEVCIVLFHRRIDEVDIFLEAPNGRILELTTDNGGDGDNYINTCFTPTATKLIADVTAADAPFTGNYLPEGDWTTIWESGSPTNGSWKLYLKDDQLGIDGILSNWWITFNSTYNISYQWENADSISCLDCPVAMVNPTETTQYKITATDSYGCTVSDSISINILPHLAAPTITCTEVTESSLTFAWEAVDNALDYEVNINNTTWTSPNQGMLAHQINNLSFDQTVDIQVRATNPANCGVEIGNTSCTTMNCIAPTPIIIAVDSAACLGENNGQITISSDITDALYVIGTDTNTTGVFTDLAAATYTAFALSANKSCGNSIDVTVHEPKVVAIRPNNIHQLSCFESNDGLIDLDVSGGTAPYRFNWTAPFNAPDTNVLSNIPAGDYFLEVRDINGCSQTIFLPIVQPENIDYQFNFTDETCFGKQDGQATVVIAPQPKTIDVLWSTQENTTAVNNLAAGDYRVSITDEHNCGDTLDFTITSPPVITLMTDSTEASCSGKNDGSATVMAVGGTGSFSFQWNDNRNQKNETASNLTVGDYQVIATDEIGCRDTAVVSVTSPNAMMIEHTTQAVSCEDRTDGVVNLMINGGTPDYAITWSDIGPLNQNNRTDLAAGSFTVIIEDANQCSEQITFEIEVAIPINIELVPTNANCGAANGSISANVTGGNGTYTYQWNDNQNQTNPTATNLRSSSYTVMVTDGLGCTKEASLDLNENEGISLDVSTTPVLCVGENSGTATVAATGGSGNYTYLWDDPTVQTTTTANNLAAGDYMILVIDDNNCEASMSVTVPDQANPININFQTANISCFGENDGQITAAVAGGQANYNYAWSNGEAQNNLTNLKAGVYYLTLTDNNGCQKIDSTIIMEPEEFFAELDFQDISCPGNRDGQIEILPFGGQMPYQYSIDGNRYSTNGQFQNLAPGHYFPAVQDANNCSFPLETIQLIESEPLTVTIDNFELESGDALQLTPQTNRDSSIALQYIWTGNNLTDLSCTDCPNPTLAATNSQSYHLQVLDENGCQAEANFTVFVSKNRQVFVPTGFSPNSDGQNDRLVVHGKEGIDVLSFKIFDRWGELIYVKESFDINDEASGWDGTYKGQLLNTNVFAWLVEVKFPDGEISLIKGHSTLIR